MEFVLAFGYDIGFGKQTERHHYIGSCALTCRFWAKKIRHYQFYELYLRSSTDVAKMKAVLDNSPHTLEPVEGLIKILHVIYKNTGGSTEIPWIHQVFFVIAAHSPMSKVKVYISLDNYAPFIDQSGHSLNSIWHYLPYKASFLHKTLNTLYLQDTHFKTVHDYFQFISELHNLASLKLKGVSWNSTYSNRPLTILPQSLEDITVTLSCKELKTEMENLHWTILAATSWNEKVPISAAEQKKKPKTVQVHLVQSHITLLVQLLEFLWKPAYHPECDIKCSMERFASCFSSPESTGKCYHLF